MKAKKFDSVKIVNKLAAEISDKQKAYREFFQKKLKEHGVESPADLSEDDKKKFLMRLGKSGRVRKSESQWVTSLKNFVRLAD